MKVFCLKPNENWICDRIAGEFYNNFSDVSSKNIFDCDVVWLLAGWCWRHVPVDILRSKKIVVTVHHIVPEKFDDNKLNDFLIRDQFVDAYHVPNDKTLKFISQLTKKPIFSVPYWFDKEKWFPQNREKCRELLGLPEESFIVGSFQRDTEGSDLITPKLEKGPDLFCDYVESMERDNIHILLGGWRRQYVISRLEKAKINYTYFEMASVDKLRQMYCALDLYVISSRYEGGPQSALEASGMKIPIVSTDVGMVSKVLPPGCIFKEIPSNFIPTSKQVDLAYEQALKFDVKSHRKNYINIFKSVLDE
jgi:glycosyltransferase involved in cell wall biosynthesis